MSGAPRRRGLVIRDYYFRGDASRPYDPAEIEAERAHLAGLTGFDIHFMHFDKMYIEDRPCCHIRLLEDVDALRPEFIWYHPHLYIDLMHMNVRPEILFAARQLYKPRLIFSFGDTAYGWQSAYLAGYAAVGDFSVAWDGNGSLLAEMVPGKTVLDLWAPRDERLYRDLGLERSIDVSFIGSRRYYQDRRDSLAELERLGIPVVTHGGDHDSYLSNDDYVRMLCESKITLNFSRTAEGDRHQIKGRVFEAILCGALLFESENSVTARYLQPYRHYVPFSDGPDLAAKIRRYLGNEPARRAIVNAAKAYVLENLSERVWWRRILDELDRTWLNVLAKRPEAAPSA